MKTRNGKQQRYTSPAVALRARLDLRGAANAARSLTPAVPTPSALDPEEVLRAQLAAAQLEVERLRRERDAALRHIRKAAATATEKGLRATRLAEATIHQGFPMTLPPDQTPLLDLRGRFQNKPIRKVGAWRRLAESLVALAARLLGR